MPLQDHFIQLFRTSGLTYGALASLSGVSTATISRMVNGSNGNVESLELLVGALEKYVADHSLTTEEEPEEELTPHCKRCRAETARYNNTLREAFERHTSMVRDNYEQRIAEIKAGHEREIARAELSITRIRRRALAFTVAFFVLAFAVIGMFIIDWTNGSVGWHRFTNGNYSDPTGNILRMLAGWLHL